MPAASASTCWRSSASSGRSARRPRLRGAAVHRRPSGPTPRQRARPAQHLAARFCAKEAVAKALALDAWSRQDVEVVSRRRRAAGRAARRRGAARRELGVEVAGVADAHPRTTAGRGGGRARVTLPWPGSSRCPTPSAMRATDRWAIEERGIPSLELMERAGAGLADVVGRARARRAGRGRLRQGQQRRRRATSPRGCCATAGREVRVLLLAPTRRAEGDAPEPRAPARRRRPSRSRPRRLDGAAGVVDALLGTGFSGAPREPAAAAAIEAINARRRARSSPPTSRAASTPRPARSRAPPCAPTPPRRSTPPSPACGSTRARPTPARSASSTSASPTARRSSRDAGLIGDARARRSSRAARPRLDEVHERPRARRRRLAPGLTGAPCLAAEAAMRAGAGYVTACVPGSLSAIFEVRLLEVDDARRCPTTTAPCRRRAPSRAGGGRARRRARRSARAWAARERRAGVRARRGRARAGAAACSTPTGSTPTPGAWTTCAAREAPTVLTPHAGELGRLLGRRRDEVDARRLHHAREAAAARAARSSCSRATTRSSPSPDGRVGVSPGGAPALATAGTGDVLSRRAGARARAGRRAVRRRLRRVRCTRARGRARRRAARGADGVIARDVIGLPPRAAGRLPARGRPSPTSWTRDPVTVTPEDAVEDGRPRAARARAAGRAGRQRAAAAASGSSPRTTCSPTSRATCTSRTTSSFSAGWSSSSR